MRVIFYLLPSSKYTLYKVLEGIELVRNTNTIKVYITVVQIRVEILACKATKQLAAWRARKSVRRPRARALFI